MASIYPEEMSQYDIKSIVDRSRVARDKVTAIEVARDAYKACANSKERIQLQFSGVNIAFYIDNFSNRPRLEISNNHEFISIGPTSKKDIEYSGGHTGKVAQGTPMGSVFHCPSLGIDFAASSEDSAINFIIPRLHLQSSQVSPSEFWCKPGK